MNDSKNFRPVNNYEKNIIANSISQISIKSISLLDEKLYYLYILINSPIIKGNQLPIYLIKPRNEDLKQLFQLNSYIYSIGLYFGFIKKGFFFLSLEGAEFLYRNKYILEKNQIIVNIQGEKSILYGNNILKKMVSNFSTELKINDLLVVLNELNEIIAIGITKVDGNDFYNLKSDDIFALNLIDKGYYLRKNQ
ncbi:MAG: PUA domain-containing protein [Promethearchaeota archaeon]|jgi:ribosome biogenesis protein Nip4